MRPAVILPNGAKKEIFSIAKGFSFIPGGNNLGEIHITKEDDNLWYASFVGSARAYNLSDGLKVPGGFRSRKQAVEWLIEHS